MLVSVLFIWGGLHIFFGFIQLICIWGVSQIWGSSPKYPQNSLWGEPSNNPAHDQTNLKKIIKYFEDTWLVGQFPPMLWNVFGLEALSKDK